MSRAFGKLGEPLQVVHTQPSISTGVSLGVHCTGIGDPAWAERGQRGGCCNSSSRPPESTGTEFTVGPGVKDQPGDKASCQNFRSQT